jgi:hypothetical protein
MLVDLKDFIAPMVTIAGSFLAAWLAARLALTRFYREKMWERKAEAYTAIFTALHDMRVWFRTHVDQTVAGSTLPDDRSKELEVAFRTARSDLERRLDAETWLLPDECMTFTPRRGSLWNQYAMVHKRPPRGA